MFEYSNNKIAEPKTYLQLKITKIIDRDTPEGEEAWMDMINHHLFAGNHTMMVFEHFYGQNCTVEELGHPDAWNGYDECPPFVLYLTKWLENNGYCYINGLLTDSNGHTYDGTLLNITW